MKIIALIGASGSGKTAIAEAIKVKHPNRFLIFHFDSIGVPSLDDMILLYGSPERWQKAETLNWIIRLANISDRSQAILFEGQMRQTFLFEAAIKLPGIELLPILIDCSDEVRARRLQIDRKQPELATEDMMNWATYLRREARERCTPVIDTTDLSLDESIERLFRILGF